MASATAQAETMPRQFSLDVGGATVDTASVGSVKWSGTEVRELDREFQKGTDVELRIVCRVTDVKVSDKYDAHGNVSETVRKHDLRVDELEVLSEAAGRFKLAPVSDPEPEE